MCYQDVTLQSHRASGSMTIYVCCHCIVCPDQDRTSSQKQQEKIYIYLNARKLQSAPGNLYLRTTDPKGPGASPMKTAPTPSTNHLLSEFCLVITVPKGTPIMNTVESLQWLRASKHSGKFSLYGWVHVSGRTPNPENPTSSTVPEHLTTETPEKNVSGLDILYSEWEMSLMPKPRPDRLCNSTCVFSSASSLL